MKTHYSKSKKRKFKVYVSNSATEKMQPMKRMEALPLCCYMGMKQSPRYIVKPDKGCKTVNNDSTCIKIGGKSTCI